MWNCRYEELYNIHSESEVGERCLSVLGANRRLVCDAILSILWVFVATTEHVAGFHPNVHLSTSNTM